MENLPNPLICLTLQHIIDQPDAVEALMREHTHAIEKCLPLALKEVFKLPAIPNAGTVGQYLITIWGEDKESGYVTAAYYGFTSVLPVINALPEGRVLNEAIHHALLQGQIETARYLLAMPAAKKIITESMLELLRLATRSGSIPTLQRVLSLNPDLAILKRMPYDILQSMVARRSTEDDILLISLPSILDELRKRMLPARYNGMMARLQDLTQMHKIPKVKKILAKYKRP